MPAYPGDLIEQLEGLHAPDLSKRQEQVAVGCELGYDPEGLAKVAVLSPHTIRRHIAMAMGRIFDGTEFHDRHDHTLLAAWSRLHHGCCTHRAWTLAQRDQLFG